MDAVFVTGTGRSGTHFTLRCLREFTAAQDYLGGREHRPTLHRVALAAMQGRPLPGRVMLRYRGLMLRARMGGRVFLDQHHPNLYHVPQLARAFPAAVFVYPDRPAVQIVASMLQHEGVSAWYDRIRSGDLILPWPNAFFGLTGPEQARDLPPHMLALARVLAHRRQALALAAAMPGHMRILPYEDLVHDRAAAFARAFSAAELATLGPVRPAEPSQPGSLTKYRDILTPAQIDEIAAAVAAPGNSP
jgi:hypothetical protein